MKESPLFAKSYDFVRWLIPQTVKFPRQQRFVIAERLQATAMDFMARTNTAGQTRICGARRGNRRWIAARRRYCLPR